MPLFLYRPGHPKCAPGSTMVSAADLEFEEVKKAVGGEGKVAIFGDAHYAGIRSPIDGTIIDSRTKHRQYMKDNGLAMYDDFKDTWAAEQKRRDAVRSGHFDTKARKEIIEKAWYLNTEKGVTKKTPEVEVRERLSAGGAVVHVGDGIVPDADKGPVKLGVDD